jgi:hypothetical protein
MMVLAALGVLHKFETFPPDDFAHALSDEQLGHAARAAFRQTVDHVRRSEWADWARLGRGNRHMGRSWVKRVWKLGWKKLPLRILAHRGQSFRRIADSVPVIADSV